MTPPQPTVSSPTRPEGKGPPEVAARATGGTEHEGTCRVLVVEDDPSFAKLLVEILRTSATKRYRSAVAPSVRAAIERLQDDSYDVIIADLGLPDSTDYETIDSLSEAAPDVPIVVLTGTADDGVRPSLEAVRRGAAYFLRKGNVDAAAVERGIHYATERKALSELLDAGSGGDEA